MSGQLFGPLALALTAFVCGTLFHHLQWWVPADPVKLGNPSLQPVDNVRPPAVASGSFNVQTHQSNCLAFPDEDAPHRRLEDESVRHLVEEPVLQKKGKDKHGRDADFVPLPFDAFTESSLPFAQASNTPGEGWLNPDVFRKAESMQNSFQSAMPFPHIEIDNFLRADAAESLLKDFPAFESGNYLNEFGLPGLKSIKPDLRSISPMYASFWKYLGSAEFLHTMSKITGIPNLLADPTMFGGGTHENKHGQNLNIHVDFNYNRNRRWHRRVNVLLYMNKQWENHWGGRIELHKNPWEPTSEDTHRTYNISFNKAVLFATSEISWHGFRAIQLPEHIRPYVSRKLISIYLYTRERPAAETAPPHSTFYVPDKAPEPCPGGASKKLLSVIKYRDDWLQHYMNLEKSTNGQLDDLLRVQMMVLQQRVHGASPKHISEGFYPDGWVAPQGWLDLQEPIGGGSKNVSIAGSFNLHGKANKMAGHTITFTILEETDHVTNKVGRATVAGAESGDFEANIQLDRTIPPGGPPTMLTLVVDSEADGNVMPNDDRSLAFVLRRLHFDGLNMI
jgi:Rps23 Pro-64 3,4-dihydroxylase Tpa1-like proline 4-hydroxylase